ncbi:MAG: nucleotidyltransferase domain-containing protein [Nanoarchaeota archaeon]
MIQEEFREAVFELVKEASSLESVLGLVLFGSVARGEADRRSDLDFLIILKNKKEKKRLNSFIHQVSKKYDINIQSVLTDKQFSGLDRNFIENILKEGIVLYGGRLEIKAGRLRLEPFVLLNYDTKNSSARERNQVNRVLYGYKAEKEYKGKKYTSAGKGILVKYNGWKVGLATIVVPFDKAKIFIGLLKDNKAECKSLGIWVPKV